jgi:hypothetical protein
MSIASQAAKWSGFTNVPDNRAQNGWSRQRRSHVSPVR